MKTTDILNDAEMPNPTSPKLETIQRVEQIEGRPWREALHALYVEQIMTIRQLEKRWGMNNRTIMRLISVAGLTRTASESVALQWVRRPDRRDSARESIKVAQEFQRVNGHWALGKTKETDEAIRSKSEKLKTRSSFFNPDVRSRAQESKRIRDREDRGRHINSRTPPTKRESIVLDLVSSWGFAVAFNHPVGLRFVDVWLPDLNLAIEVSNTGNTFNAGWSRHAEICRFCRVIYLTNRFVDRGDFRQLHQYITGLEIRSLDPSPERENTVIWGSRKMPIGWQDHPHHVTAVHTLTDGVNRLDVTATTDR